MSFLYDNDVFSKLALSLLKKAQTAAPAAPEPTGAPGASAISPEDMAAAKDKDTIAMAKKLVAKLSADLAGTTIQPNITSEDDAELSVQSLQNIDVFLAFLATHKVMFNGERLVYPKDEYLSGNRPEGYYPISSKTTRSDPDRQWNVVDFVANKRLLVAYIQYLQQKARAMKVSGKEGERPTGQVLEVMIGKLIDAMNRTFNDTGLSRQPKSQPGKPNEMADDTVLDQFGSKILDIAHPEYDSVGSLVLTAKDVKSKQALNAWMLTGPVAQLAQYDDKKQRTLVPFDSTKDPRPNLCHMVQVLYARAQNMARYAKTDDEVKKASFYIKKIQEIGPQFTAPDGTACVVGAITGTTTSTQPGAGAGKGTGTGADGEGSQGSTSSGELNKLLRLLPFTKTDINFDRIDSFFTGYESIIKPNEASQAYKQISDVRTMINTIRNSHAAQHQSASDFILVRDPVQFSYYAAPPSGQNYVPLVDGLKYVIFNTMGVIQDIMNRYAGGGAGGVGQQRLDSTYLKAQLSIGRDNMLILDDLRRQVSRVTGQIGTPKK